MRIFINKFKINPNRLIRWKYYRKVGLLYGYDEVNFTSIHKFNRYIYYRMKKEKAEQN